MAFLKKNNPKNDGKCDLCGESLEEAENPVPDAKGDHEFCSPEHQEEYEENPDSHGHEEDEEEYEVCEFC